MTRIFRVAFAAFSVLATLASAHFEFENVRSHHAQSLVAGTGSLVAGVGRRPGGRRVWEAEANAEQKLLEKELGKMTALARELQMVLNTAQWSPPEWHGINLGLVMKNQRDFEKALKDIQEAAAEERRRIIRDVAASNVADCPECRAVPPPEVVGTSAEEAPDAEVPQEEVRPEEVVPSVPEEASEEETPEQTPAPGEEGPPEEVEPSIPQDEETKEARAQTPASNKPPPLSPPQEVPPATAEEAPEETSTPEEEAPLPQPQPKVPGASPIEGPVTPELTPREKVCSEPLYRFSAKRFGLVLCAGNPQAKGGGGRKVQAEPVVSGHLCKLHLPGCKNTLSGYGSTCSLSFPLPRR
uniref:Uncharacterized protein n=1 Tax=Neospora caninum (strain Liverpool) TaxID=572307 RepID=A0A0F7URH7_NEOCL|nr:TPA: hypothetical protein BN1204_067390 [Neospora caninum Liverpool]